MSSSTTMLRIASLINITIIVIIIISSLATDASALNSDSGSEVGHVTLEPMPLAAQVRIRQCRQRCYHQILQFTTSQTICYLRPDCYMCHDYCRVLLIADTSLATSMCADRIFCSRGCRTACHFHRLPTVPPANALDKA